MRRSILTMTHWLYAVCALLCLAGCVHPRTSSVTDSSAVLLTSANLQLDADAAVAADVYILVRNQTGKAKQLPALLARDVRQRGYGVSTSPSQAGYIVQCNVVFAGQLNKGAAERLVPLGYGKPVGGVGGDESVLMADVILAVRHVPEQTSKKHGDSLTYGTRRSKIDEHHLRMAACVGGDDYDDSQQALETKVSAAVAGLLPAR